MAAKSTIFFLFIAAAVISRSRSCFLTARYDIFVVNEIPNSQLKLRCASKDDDLGVHYLKQHENYHWDFCLNFVRDTLFFCHLYVGNKQKQFNAIDDKVKLDCRHSICNWIARDDGVYFSDDRKVPTNGMVKKFDWEPLKA